MKQYWETVIKSDLLSDQEMKKAVSHIRSLPPEKKGDKAEFGRWLVDQGWISQFHHENFIMSLPGPFHFGPVVVHDQLPGPAFQESYAARISDSNNERSHPVIASFVEEGSERILDALQSHVELSRILKHPHLLSPLGFAKNGDASFVLEPPYHFWNQNGSESNVNRKYWDKEKPKSRPLSELILPRKGFSFKSSLQIAADISCGLYALEQNDSTHFFVTPASVIVGPKSRALLRVSPDTGIFGQTILDFLDRVFPDSKAGLQNAALIDTGKRAPTVKVGNLPAQDIDQILLKTMEDRRWCLADYLPLEMLELLSQFQKGQNPDTQQPKELAKRKNQFVIGALLYQMLVGSLPFEGDSLEEKIQARKGQPLPIAADIPDKIKKFIFKLLDGKESLSTEKITMFLYSALSTKPLESNPFEQISDDSFVQSILSTSAENIPKDEEPIQEKNHSESVPSEDANSEEPGHANPFSSMKVESRVEKRRGRKKSKKSRSGILWGAISALVICIAGTAAYYAGFFGPIELASNDPVSGKNDDQPGKIALGGGTSNKTDLKVSNPSGWTQNVVADDGENLWESPTTGLPVQNTHLPNGASAIAFLSPKIFQNRSIPPALAALSLGSFQPELPPFGFTVDQWEKWSQVSIGIYQGKDQQFDQVFAAWSEKEIDLSLENWQIVALLDLEDRKTKAAVLRHPNFESYSAICFTDPINTDSSSPALVMLSKPGSLQAVSATQSLVTKKVLFFPHHRLEQCLDLSASGSLNRAFKEAMKLTDRNRHLQVIFSPATLRSTQASKSFQTYWEKIPSFHQIHWPLGIRASYLSSHWTQEGACYVESKFLLDRRQKSGGFLEQIKERVLATPEKVELAIRSFPPHPAWDRILIKFDDMVSDFVRRVRYGSHNKVPTINAWLPPKADQNLLAGTAVFLYGINGAGGIASSSPSSVPAQSKILTVENLLKSKWDLDIPEQDLVNAVLELKTDILSEHRNLPFQFDIRLDGNALKMDGITQNQKITNFKATQKEIGQILTDIAITANPDQNVSQPNDPGCKLIWVIRTQGKDQSVLFTTRSAAEKNRWKIPTVFQIKK